MTFYKSENKIRIFNLFQNKQIYSQNNKSAEEVESSDNFSSFALIFGSLNLKFLLLSLDSILLIKLLNLIIKIFKKYNK